MKNYDETTDQITLTLDDDSELLCDVIATFPAKVNGKEQMYIALIPTDAEPEDDIFLYRFIENGDEEQSIRVRLRSRFVHINSIAEKYHGGGHACASGATVYGEEEMQQLLQDADALIKEYKETHEGWL